MKKQVRDLRYLEGTAPPIVQLQSRQSALGPKHALRMKELSHLFVQNQAWADAIRGRDPEFFLKLSRQQSPQYLWIG